MDLFDTEFNLTFCPATGLALRPNYTVYQAQVWLTISNCGLHNSFLLTPDTDFCCYLDIYGWSHFQTTNGVCHE